MMNLLERKVARGFTTSRCSSEDLTVLPKRIKSLPDPPSLFLFVFLKLYRGSDRTLPLSPVVSQKSNKPAAI